ncbi:MAG: galactose oxidase-like domain-containing protein [Planctomycetota bacterium]
MPINPIHVGVLHDGRVLVIAGSENDPDQHDDGISLAAVYDWRTGAIVEQDLLWDLFCNGFSMLADGRVFIIGGTERYDDFTGDPRATIFDPATDQFVQVESMQDGRWYATGTTLPDGRVMAFSGLDLDSGTNVTVEIYKVGDGWSPEYPAPWEPPLYPWMHVLPDGQLVFTGSTRDSHLFDPATQTWTLRIARTVYNGDRFYGSSVLLPLLPENGYQARVMIMGGDSPATPNAEVLDLSQSSPAWRALPPMSLPRVQMNAVLLPDGKVLAQGGSAYNEDEPTASKAADLFDPVTETWSPAGVAAYARLYHSVALLLPDATVWTAGSNPQRGIWEPHMEIYSPPYLFTTDPGTGNVIPATRPSIAAAPAVIGYGGTFLVDTPDDLDIASIALVRPGSDTHAWDMEQRLIRLSFTRTVPGTLGVGEPPNANIAPPGYYMLFLVNGAGVPSMATFVRVSPTPQNQPPAGVITEPSADLTIAVGASVSFAGAGSDPEAGPLTYHWIFPDGSPAASTAPNPGDVMFCDAGTYVVSLTVIDSQGENDPSPPTRTITVVPGQLPGVPTGLGSPDHTLSVWSSNPTVTVSWTAADDPGGSGIDGYSLAWDHSAATIPDMVKDIEAAPTEFVQTLASAPAGWYFHVRAVDNLGSWGNAAHFGPILIDTQAPDSASSLASPDHDVSVWSQDPSVSVTWSAASDADSGLDGYSVVWDHDAASTPDAVKDLEADATELAQTLASAPTGWYFHIRAVDSAGNWGNAAHFGPILIDTQAPGGAVQIDGGAATTASLLVALDLSATDGESGMGSGATMQFSNDGITFSSEEPYAPVRNGWDLSAFGGNAEPGTKTVQVRFRDVAGNQSAAAADSIEYAPVPALSAIEPDRGPYGGGTAVTITGSGFTPAVVVKCGTLRAASVTFVSSSELIAATPAYDGGPFGSYLVRVNVSVTNSAGTGVLPRAYKYHR